MSGQSKGLSLSIVYSQYGNGYENGYGNRNRNSNGYGCSTESFDLLIELLLLDKIVNIAQLR